MSFDLFAYKELKHVVSDCEDRYHQIERQLKWNDRRGRREVQTEAVSRIYRSDRRIFGGAGR